MNSIQLLSSAISKKHKSNSKAIKIGNKQSVVPDYDSPFLKWVIFTIGVAIATIGIILLGFLIIEVYYFDEFAFLLGLTLVLLIAIGAGLYFLASHGFDDLEDHSLAYQIGFYLSVFSPFLFLLPAIIGLPMLIIAAVFENWE